MEKWLDRLEFQVVGSAQFARDQIAKARPLWQTVTAALIWFPIFAVPEVISQRNFLHAVHVARRVLRCKVSESVPALALAELAIACRRVSKRVERSVVSVALNRL